MKRSSKRAMQRTTAMETDTAIIVVESFSPRVDDPSVLGQSLLPRGKL
jgi:hypothetical protein